MKINRKIGIGLFWLVGIIMAAIILLHYNPAAPQQAELAKKLISVGVIAFACTAFTVWYDKITSLPVELFQSRHLIWKLAKNDFKKRYAGS